MKFRNEVYKLGSGGARQILSLINTGGTQSRQSTLGHKYSCLTSIQLTVKQHSVAPFAIASQTQHFRPNNKTHAGDFS